MYNLNDQYLHKTLPEEYVHVRVCVTQCVPWLSWSQFCTVGQSIVIIIHYLICILKCSMDTNIVITKILSGWIVVSSNECLNVII